MALALLQEIPTFVEDSSDMLRQFEEENLKGHLPVDVTALYTNIRAEGPEGGFQAFEKALNKREDKSVPTSYLMDLLKATINGNIFEFDDQLYRQCIGTAMGTRIAPTYACLYMSYFESEKILSTWPGTPPKMFKRYIDDCFFVWTSSVEELKEFINHMNSQSNFIKFTSEYNQETRKVPFLDMMVSNESDKFSTDLYKKETFKPQYLHPSSCHIGHQSKNIPYSLAYRLRRICSNDTNFELRLSELKTDLLSRGYYSKIIDTAFNKARLIPRSEALKKVPKKKNEREVFVCTFNPALPSIKTIVQKHWSVMTGQSANLKRVFPQPSLIAYRRPKNLREHLIRAKISSKRKSSRLKNGYGPCNEGCQTCWISVKKPKRSGKFQPPLTVKPRMSFIIWGVKRGAKSF